MLSGLLLSISLLAFAQQPTSLAPLADQLANAKSDADRATLTPNPIPDGLYALLRSRGEKAYAATDYPAAIANHSAALFIARKTNNTLDQARTHRSLGLTRNRQFLFDEALQIYTDGLALARQAKDRGLEAELLRGIGLCHRNLQDYPSARKFYQAAIEILNQIGNRHDSLGTQVNLAVLDNSLGYYSRAIQSYRTILSEASELKLNDIIELARFNLATSYAEQGDADLAYSQLISLMERARAINSKRDILLNAVNLGPLLRRMDRNTEALQNYNEAIQISNELHDNLRLSNTYVNRGSLYREMNQREPATRDLAKALEIAERIGNDHNLADILNAVAANHLQWKEYDLALATAERANQIMAPSGRVDPYWATLATAGQAHRLLGHPTEARHYLEKSVELIEQVRQNRFRGTIEGLFFLRGRTTPYEEILELDYAEKKFDHALAITETLKSPNAQPINTSRLAAGHGLINFVVTPKGTLVFLIDRSSTTLHTLPITLKEVSSEVESFRHTIATRDLHYRDQASSLYKKLLAPFDSFLRTHPNLTILPDGPLWDLPFSVLTNAANKHLLETHALSFAPSVSRVLHPKAASQAPNSVLTLADPALPLQVTEAQAVSRILPNSRLLQSNYSEWFTIAPKYKILHIASHATFNSQFPLNSAIELGNPPILAREILSVPLDADLAVLSACETGRGKVAPGEGLIGTSWAFLSAGARSVLVSQWKVDSASTSQFMTAFYNHHLKQSQAKPAALQKAALALRAQPQFAHPFYWAPFLLIQ